VISSYGLGVDLRMSIAATLACETVALGKLRYLRYFVADEASTNASV
jgi:hypothetical protein